MTAAKKSLPYILSGSAEFRLMVCEGFNIIVVKPHNEDDFRMSKNIVTSVEKKLQLPTVLILDSIDSYQRRSLIENRIGFIVPDRQIYLPALGALLNERGMGVKAKESDMLSAVAGAIIIWQLSKGSLDGKSVTEVADKIGYSVKTLSLAVNELERQELVSIKQTGRKKMLDFRLSRRELWDKAFPIMNSPIEKRMFTSDAALAEEIGVKSSDTALSEMSMLTSPNQNRYAIYARDRRLEELGLNPSEGDTIIEIWKTDPKNTANNGMVDVFSLALTYKDDDDPRVKKELDKIINEKL